MNWVGGSRNRIKLNEQGKKKKEFFERQRQRGREVTTTSNQGQSQDIVSMKTLEKVNRNLWHLPSKGDRALKTRAIDMKSSADNESTSRLNHVEISPGLCKPGQFKHPQEILNRALRGPAAVPSWSTFTKPSLQEHDSSTSSKQRTSSTFGTDQRTCSKLANTPTSARVKRRPSDGDRPSHFFTDLPEFKKLKSENALTEMAFPKLRDCPTPGYKDCPIFERVSEVFNQENCLNSLIEEVQDSSFEDRSACSSEATSSSRASSDSLPKPIFSDKSSLKRTRDSDLWSFDSFGNDSLSSVLVPPIKDSKSSDKGKERLRSQEMKPVFSNQSSNCRSGPSFANSGVSDHSAAPSFADQSASPSFTKNQLKSQDLDMSLSSFGILEKEPFLEEEKNTFPILNFSTTSSHPIAKFNGDFSFLASQKISQEMMDKRFRDSWISMKNTPRTVKRGLSSSHFRKLPNSDVLDESRDLFAEEQAPSPSVSKFGNVKETENRSFSQKRIPSSSLTRGSSVLDETVLGSSPSRSGVALSGVTVQLPTTTPYNSPQQLPSQHVDLSPPRQIPIKTTNSSVQTETKTEDFSAPKKIKSLLYTMTDHSYCKSNPHYNMLLSAIFNLSFVVESGTCEVKTQTTAVQIVDRSYPVRKSDSQNSKSPPPKDDFLNEIVHFGETDFSSELEIADSTPRECTPEDEETPQDSCEPSETKFSCTTVSEEFGSFVEDLLSPKPNTVVSDDKNTDCDPEATPSEENRATTEEPPSRAISKESKRRVIIWPDEEMFFVKLPELPQKSNNKFESDMEVEKKFSPMVTQTIIEPNNMVLKITNSKPVKSASPSRKFVPFFTSQNVKKLPKGTQEDPINLSPETTRTCLSISSPCSPVKRSPFMIVGKRTGLNEDDNTCSVHGKCRHTGPQIEGLSTDKNSHGTDKTILIESDHISKLGASANGDETADNGDDTAETTDYRNCATSSPASCKPAFLSQQLPNRRPVRRCYSQPIGNSSYFPNSDV